jgi:hypothetical protein
MYNTTKKLKVTIKRLAEEKISTSRDRKAFKKKASPKFKKTPEYHCWFLESDCDRKAKRYGIRHHLLAYALLRGRPYRTVEKKCRRKPDASSIKLALMMNMDFEAPEDMEPLDELISNIEEWLDVSSEIEEAA